MKKRKFSALLMLLVLAFSFLVPVGQVKAATGLEVQAQAGINGKAKVLTKVPLTITVKNNGDAFSGDLAIDASSNYEIGSAMVIPFDIAEGEEKTLTLYLEGLEYYGNPNANDSIFTFYEGGIEKGKAVKYKGTKQVQTNNLEPNAQFIFTLTENSDRLSSYLRLSQFSSSGVEIFHLNQLKNFTLPTDPQGYEMANILAIDEFSVADLSEAQQNAILKWVQNGGTLLYGASDQADAASGILKQHLPLTLSNEKTTVTAESLGKLSGGGLFKENISVYKAEQKTGSKPVLADGETILASENKIGSGRIIQTTFSLGDQPLATMDGYGRLTAAMLHMNASNMQQNYPYQQSIKDKISYEIKEINELFPSFEVSVSFVLIVVILYILIIGPILYFVLKRFDKREHAWWIIPAISIVLSMSLFVFGAKDRLVQPQVQQSAFYKVNDDGSISGHYVESILTNRGGDFVATTDENTTAQALQRNDEFTSASKQLHEKSYVKQHANGSVLTMRDLSYWSVQSFTGQTSAQKVGKMDIDLTLKNNQLTGSIKNNFSFALKDVTLLSGTKEVKLGDIEPNETLKINKDIKTAILQKPITSNFNYQQPSTKKDINPIRIDRLKYASLELVANEQSPIISAWAEQALVGVELESSTNMSPISYFVQPFEANVIYSGPFTLKRTNFMYDVKAQTANATYEKYDEQLNDWYLTDGTFEITTTMPKEFKGKVKSWQELTITNKDTNRMQISVWNNSTKAFESISDTKWTLTENIANYISEDGSIKMQVVFGPNSTGEPTKLPEVELKGVAGE